MNAREIFAAGSPPRLPTNPATGNAEADVPAAEAKAKAAAVQMSSNYKMQRRFLSTPMALTKLPVQMG